MEFSAIERLNEIKAFEMSLKFYAKLNYSALFPTNFDTSSAVKQHVEVYYVYSNYYKMKHSIDDLFILLSKLF